MCSPGINRQLGLGDVKKRVVPTVIKFFHQRRIIQVSAGGYHSLFLDESGRMYSTGFNEGGQLGLLLKGRRSNVLVPTPVSFNGRIRKVIGGGTRSFIISKQYRVFTCGSNRYGQLGVGDTLNRRVFTKVQFPSSTKQNEEQIISIFANFSHTFFLSRETRRVFTCGWNTNGQLGLGHVQKIIVHPTLVTFKFNSEKVKSIGIGGGHSIFLTEKGKVYSCGKNNFGQCGSGDDKYRSSPILIKKFSGRRIKQIVASNDHSLFLYSYANDARSRVYFSGYNYENKLDGLSTSRINKTPVKVKWFDKYKSCISKIYSGTNHLFFVEVLIFRLSTEETNENVKKKLRIFAIGGNENGELGFGDFKNRDYPEELKVNIELKLKVKDISKLSVYKMFLQNYLKEIKYLNEIVNFNYFNTQLSYKSLRNERQKIAQFKNNLLLVDIVQNEDIKYEFKKIIMEYSNQINFLEKSLELQDSVLSTTKKLLNLDYFEKEKEEDLKKEEEETSSVTLNYPKIKFDSSIRFNKEEEEKKQEVEVDMVNRSSIKSFLNNLLNLLSIIDLMRSSLRVLKTENVDNFGKEFFENYSNIFDEVMEFWKRLISTEKGLDKSSLELVGNPMILDIVKFCEIISANFRSVQGFLSKDYMNVKVGIWNYSDLIVNRRIPALKASSSEKAFLELEGLAVASLSLKEMLDKNKTSMRALEEVFDFTFWGSGLEKYFESYLKDFEALKKLKVSFQEFDQVISTVVKELQGQFDDDQEKKRKILNLVRQIASTGSFIEKNKGVSNYMDARFGILKSKVNYERVISFYSIFQTKYQLGQAFYNYDDAVNLGNATYNLSLKIEDRYFGKKYPMNPTDELEMKDLEARLKTIRKQSLVLLAVAKMMHQRLTQFRNTMKTSQFGSDMNLSRILAEELQNKSRIIGMMLANGSQFYGLLFEDDDGSDEEKEHEGFFSFFKKKKKKRRDSKVHLRKPVVYFGKLNEKNKKNGVGKTFMHSKKVSDVGFGPVQYFGNFRNGLKHGSGMSFSNGQLKNIEKWDNGKEVFKITKSYAKEENITVVNLELGITKFQNKLPTDGDLQIPELYPTLSDQTASAPTFVSTSSSSGSQVSTRSSSRLNTIMEIPSKEISKMKDEKGKAIILGVGGFGKVFKVLFDSSEYQEKIVVAMKEVTIDVNINMEQIEKLIHNEVKMVKFLSHKNVVKVYGYVLLNQYQLGICLEYMAGGSLYQYIQSLKKTNHDEFVIPDKKKWSLVKQMIISLYYLHNKGIIHRDVKPHNFLLDKARDVIKISDFGLAKMKSSTSSASSGGLKGTLRFLSPELHTSSKPVYTTKSDIFALGLTVYTLVCERIPWHENDNDGLVAIKIIQGQKPECQEKINKAFKLIIDNCLKLSPKDRLDSKDLLKIVKEHEEGKL